MDVDVAIVGAGPAGLSLANALGGSRLSVAVLDAQPLERLAAPGFDGREIALTHRSRRILEELGAWDALPGEAVAPMRAAQVLNGRSPFALVFDSAQPIEGVLGWLVPNHCIRHALFHATARHANVALHAGNGVTALETGADGVRLTLADGANVRARLLVGADSRLSGVRDRLGIAAEMHRLGRSMLVCRMTHARDHGRIATEWFDHRQTLALLPLDGAMSSAVITLPAPEAEALAALDEAAFEAEVTRRFAGRLGAMRLASTRHLYPLTVTWSHRFTAQRAALIGDAAVGMHPVTAHGFNLGLLGQDILARLVLRAAERGRDIASDALLRGYALRHRLASRPIYDATNLIVGLYTREGPAARAARHATLRLAQRLPFARRAVGAMLASR